MKNICPYDHRVVCGYLEPSDPHTQVYGCCDCPRYKPGPIEPESAQKTKIFHFLVAVMAIIIIVAAYYTFHWLINYFRP
jgi:hypothetical protein